MTPIGTREFEMAESDVQQTGKARFAATLSKADEHRYRWKVGWRRVVRDRWHRSVRHPLEMAFTLACVWLVRRLSVDGCSAFGAWLGRAIGYRSGRTRIARAALQSIFPEWPKEKVEHTVLAMWDHLGRVAMEYVRLDGFRGEAGKDRLTIEGIERLHALRDDGKGALIVSGHVGHWEMITLALQEAGVTPLHVVYRPANNEAMNRLIRSLQGDSGVDLIPKGAAGARRIMAALKAGGHVVMLVDQKMNDGIETLFFGRPAMTAPAVAQLALRFSCPVVPIRVERVGSFNRAGKKAAGPTDGSIVGATATQEDAWGARFKVSVGAEIERPKGEDKKTDILTLMNAINAELERWIRDRPEQWLWVHKRWSQHPPAAQSEHHRVAAPVENSGQ